MNKNKKPKMTKNDLKTAKRLMKYVTEKYKLQLIFHIFLKCTLCQGHYDFFLFRFLFYICLLCRGIKVMPLIDCFHLLL